MKSGNLNFLEPSGPLQACNGTALTFYSLRNIISIIRTMKWAGRVARMWERLAAYSVLLGKSEGDYLEVLGADGRIILKLIFRQ